METVLVGRIDRMTLEKVTNKATRYVTQRKYKAIVSYSSGSD